MTDQEAFNIVYKHLMTQDAASRDPISRVCKYITPDGMNKCAIGCLLPNALCFELDTLFVTSWCHVARCNEQCAKDAAEILSDVREDLLERLQKIHDKTSALDTDMRRAEMKRRLAYVAAQYELQVPE